MKYEYDLISLIDRPRDVILDILNTFGKVEWELVSVDNGMAFFKRPIEKCPQCQGFGKFLITFGEFETCQACGGSGYKE